MSKTIDCRECMGTGGIEQMSTCRVCNGSGKIAAPVVERQDDPIYQVRYLGEGGGGWVDVEKDEFDRDKAHKNYHTRTVFASPPAPVAVDLNDAEEFEKWWRSTPILRKGKLQIAREAWKARACLDKVKELNQ